MSKKINMNLSKDIANPDFKTEVLFIQGKRIEVTKGQTVNVDPIVKEILEESMNKYAKFATSNEKITPDTGVRTGI